MYKAAVAVMLLSACACSKSGTDEMKDAVKGFDFSLMPVSYRIGSSPYYAYQNLDGERVYEVKQVESVNSRFVRGLSLFHEGYGIETYDGGFAIINQDGEVVADLKGYGCVDNSFSGRYVSEGFALAYQDRPHTTFCFTPQGEEVFELEGKARSQFRAGYALYTSKRYGEKLGLIDTKGEVVYEPEQDEYIPDWYSMNLPASYAHPTWFPLYSESEPVCIFDVATGKRYLEGVLDEYSFGYMAMPAVDCNDRMVVCSDDKFGLIDLDGNVVVEPQYDYMRNDGEWYVYGADGLYGWLDKDGKVMIEAEYRLSGAMGFSDLGFAMSGLSRIDTHTFINRKNEVALETEYAIVSNFIGDRCLVDLGRDGYSWMDRNGELIGEPMFVGDMYYRINSVSMGVAIQY